MKKRANNRHTLVLHIGMPKTGTTSIQTFLYHNAEELKQYGWSYPPFTHIWYRMERGWSDLRLKNGFVFKNSFSEGWSRKRILRLWGFVRSYLRRYNVIISEEGMWHNSGMDTIKSIKFIKKIYPNIKIIVYLRRQDLFVDALWNQMVKIGDIQVESIRTYKNDERLIESLDYYSILRKIECLVGRENLIVRVFEKESLIEGDLINDFLVSLKIPVDLNCMKDHQKRENERLDEELLAVKQEFNKTYAKYISEIDRPSTIVQNNYTEAIMPDKDRFGYLKPDERKEILEKYEKGNQHVAKRYLGREDGVLFYDRDIQISVYDSKMTDREKRIIHLFARIAAEQDNDLEKLKQQKPFDYLKRTICYIMRHILIKLKQVFYPFIAFLLPYL